MHDTLLHTPVTYSFQESTFARRLQRAFLEMAYYILTNPASSKEDVYRIFGFCFFFTDAKSMAHRIGGILKQSSNEPLDNWWAPFHPPGGTGTHYPQIDGSGNRVLPRDGRTFGPRLLRSEISQPKDATTEQLLALSGWDGAWLDPHDVQEYLRSEKGLRLNSESTFGELDVPLCPAQTAISPNHASPSHLFLDSVAGDHWFINNSSSPPQSNSQDHHYLNSSNSRLRHLNIPSSATTPVFDLPVSRNTYIDPFRYQPDIHANTTGAGKPMFARTTLTIDLSRLLTGQVHLYSPFIGFAAAVG